MNKVSILLGFIALLFLWGQRLHAQELYTLEKTLDVAYQNSPDIQTQQLSLEQSRERLNAQKAGLKSRFSLSVDPFSYEKKRSYEQLLSQWYNYKTISSSGTFSIVQPIKATDGKISLMNQFGYVNSTTNDKTPEEYYSNNVSLNISQPLFSK